MANFEFRRAVQFDSYPPEAAARCAPLLEEAARLADAARSDLLRWRVDLFRTAFDVAYALTLQHHQAKKALPLLEGSETLPDGLDLLADALRYRDEAEAILRLRLKHQKGVVTSAFEVQHDNIFQMTAAALRNGADRLTQIAVSDIQGASKGRVTRRHVDRAARAAMKTVLSRISDPATVEAIRNRLAPFGARIAICDRVKIPPRMDGKLMDSAWRKAPPISSFVRSNLGGLAAYHTELCLCHDSERLYLGFRCFQDTSRLLLWTSGRDHRVMQEESVGLLIGRPTESLQDRKDCQVHVSPAGNIYDAYDGSIEWDGDIQVGTGIQPECYVVEFSIRLREIDIDPAKDRFLRVNFVRSVFDPDGEGRKFRAKENPVWFPTAAGIADPDARGWLILNP